MADGDIAKGILEGLEEAVAWKKRLLELEATEIGPTLGNDTKVIEPSPEAAERQLMPPSGR